MRGATCPAAAIFAGQTACTGEPGGKRGGDGRKMVPADPLGIDRAVRIDGAAIDGRKRHPVVDSQGGVLHARAPAADAHDHRAAYLAPDGLGERQPAVISRLAGMAIRGLGASLERRSGW